MHPDYTSKDIQRFWSKVKLPDLIGTDECWPWMAGCDNSGYGAFWFNGKMTNAQRVAYMLTLGPIPNELMVCHSCDNPPCCNPAHLFLGTQHDNVIDMMLKGRGRYITHLGEHHGMSKLTANDVREIRLCYASGVSQRKLARIFDVNRRTISFVIKRITWKHIK